MKGTDFDCPQCENVGLREIADKDAVWLSCPRCKRTAAVYWMEDPIPEIPGQMSMKDYPETSVA